MAQLTFPPQFFFGTSTAAAQVETAFDHQWKGVQSLDGYTLDRTTDHELHRTSDAEIIARLGTVYRCGVDWSRLQRGPNEALVSDDVKAYQDFFALLNQKGVKIMFVLHHFANPNWFEAKGAWTKQENIPYFLDFATKCMDAFGSYVSYWNTFNEPNVYAMNAYMTGNFPPKQSGAYFTANRVLKHMGKAHDLIYDQLKTRFPEHPVGISLNTAIFEGANWLGKLPAAFTDWWFHEKAARPFSKSDFWGLSYYAWVLFDPTPITEIDRPGKLAAMGLPHDKMWGYKPEGLLTNIRRFHEKYGKPIIITENGICSEDPLDRIKCLKDYLSMVHQAIAEGIDVAGYVHWSTWDNFEWHLGPTYRFGLVSIHLQTMEREWTAAADFYQNIVKTHTIDV